MSIRKKKKQVKAAYLKYLYCFEEASVAHKMFKKWKPSKNLIIKINPLTEW